MHSSAAEDSMEVTEELGSTRFDDSDRSYVMYDGMKEVGGGTDKQLMPNTTKNANSTYSLDNLGVEDEDSVPELLDVEGQSALMEKIRDQKKRQMFVSGWENDEDGIEQKNMDDPNEKVLTAAENGSVEALQNLLATYPGFIEVRDSDGYTPLHRAAYGGHVDVVRYLLSLGANPELRTNDGWTVLHCAACWSMYEVVTVLLSYGVDVNARSNGRLTPLHLAINSNQSHERTVHTVRHLVEAPGIDISATSNSGETPLMLARRTSPIILEIIERHIKKP